ncbi:hypothetical protein Hanom_Chr04g00292581 [Helianthus anomalus]
MEVLKKTTLREDQPQKMNVPKFSKTAKLLGKRIKIQKRKKEKHLFGLEFEQGRRRTDYLK